MYKIKDGEATLILKKAPFHWCRKCYFGKPNRVCPENERGMLKCAPDFLSDYHWVETLPSRIAGFVKRRIGKCHHFN